MAARLTLTNEKGKFEDVATPLVSIMVIKRVVRALYHWKDQRATYKDIAAGVDLHHVTASQGLSAARDLGLTQLAGRKGLHALTAQGIEYGRLLDAGKDNEAQLFLKNLVVQNPKWGSIVTFLRLNRGNPRQVVDLVLDTERILGKQWSPRMRHKVGRTYISILEYAGLVKSENNTITSLLEEEAPPSEEKDIEQLPPGGLLPVSEEMEGPPAENFARFETADVRISVRLDKNAIALARNFLNLVEKQIPPEKSEAKQNSNRPIERPIHREGS